MTYERVANRDSTSGTTNYTTTQAGIYKALAKGDYATIQVGDVDILYNGDANITQTAFIPLRVGVTVKLVLPYSRSTVSLYKLNT